MEEIWLEIDAFHEQIVARSSRFSANDKDSAIEHAFKEKVSLETLFKCLDDASDTQNSSRVKTVCACIDHLLSCNAVDPQFFQSKQTLAFILGGLRHHEEQAQELTLAQVEAQLYKNSRSKTPSENGVLADNEIMHAICDLIASENGDIACKASNVVVKLATGDGSEVHETLVDVLHQNALECDTGGKSVELMRYLETIARLCSTEKVGQYVASSGSMKLILGYLESNDSLLILNIMELLPKLCQTKAGLQFISDSDTLRNLLAMAEDPLVGTESLRFIGEVSTKVAELNVKCWNWGDPVLTQAFFDKVKDKLQDPEDIQKIAAMDAIGAFAASSHKELQVLIQHEICSQYLEMASSLKMPLKVNCLHSVKKVLAEPTRLQHESCDILEKDAEIWNLNKTIYEALGRASRSDSTTEYLMSLLKQPFEELRIAVYGLLQAVAAQNAEWGLQALISYGGFFEYILDRNTEPTKECREWKFAVVDAILASPFTNLLDTSILLKLKEHLRKGPYIGNPRSALEMEAA
ncbi:unnamed protein product [Albugo candida]|uniref:26S proteasome non-ATPase regulatory subunit 5 n=1 Tax=Albugo candida TaxID=65357 RepID=A0A024FZL4_9STRA|nr:unnamed protein product [Albugo candida]|eukprot:CCI39753.1 unnamed protein product [Albugo candida]